MTHRGGRVALAILALALVVVFHQHITTKSVLFLDGTSRVSTASGVFVHAEIAGDRHGVPQDRVEKRDNPTSAGSKGAQGHYAEPSLQATGENNYQHHHHHHQAHSSHYEAGLGGVVGAVRRAAGSFLRQVANSADSYVPGSVAGTLRSLALKFDEDDDIASKHRQAVLETVFGFGDVEEEESEENTDVGLDTTMRSALAQLRDVKLGRSSLHDNELVFYYEDPQDVYSNLQHIHKQTVLINKWVCPDLENTGERAGFVLDAIDNEDDVSETVHNSDMPLPVVKSEQLLKYFETLSTSATKNYSQFSGFLSSLGCYPSIFLPDQRKHRFRTILKGQSIPLKSHVRMNMTTGKREAKLIDPNEPTDGGSIDEEKPHELSIRVDKDFNPIDEEPKDVPVEQPGSEQEATSPGIKIHHQESHESTDGLDIDERNKEILKKFLEEKNSASSDDGMSPGDVPNMNARQKLSAQEKGVLYAMLSGQDADDIPLEDLRRLQEERITGSGDGELSSERLESIIDIKSLEFVSDIVHQVDHGIEFAENHIWRLLGFKTREKRLLAISIIGNAASNNPVAAALCQDKIGTLIEWALDSCKPEYEKALTNSTYLAMNTGDIKDVGRYHESRMSKINIDNALAMEREYELQQRDFYCLPFDKLGEPIEEKVPEVIGLLGPDKKIVHKLLFGLGKILRSGTQGYRHLDKLNRLYVNISPFYEDELERLTGIVNEVIREDYLVFEDKSEEEILELFVKNTHGPVGEIARTQLEKRKEALKNKA